MQIVKYLKINIPNGVHVRLPVRPGDDVMKVVNDFLNRYYYRDKKECALASINEQYVHNRSFEGTRNDFGNKELQGLSINPNDLPLIEEIKVKEPNRLKSANKRYGK